MINIGRAVLLVCAIVIPAFAGQKQNELIKISLSRIEGSVFGIQDSCSLAATDLYFGKICLEIGLLCNNEYFSMYLPDSLSYLPDDLQGHQELNPNHSLQKLWTFSNKMIVARSVGKILLYFIENELTLKISGENYNSKRPQPLLSSATNKTLNYYAQTYFNPTIKRYVTSLDKIKFQDGQIEPQWQYDYITSDQLQTNILFWAVEDQVRFYRTYKIQENARIVISQSKDGTINPQYKIILTQDNNCASSLAVSPQYLAAACPSSNIITIYDNISYEEICSVIGPSRALFGEQMVIYQHSFINASSIATIFVSGYIPNEKLHFVTQVHLLPSKQGNTIECQAINAFSDHLVSHQIFKDLPSSELEVGISQNYLFVFLKSSGQQYNYEKRTLYYSSLSDFQYSTPDKPCPHHHFSASVISSPYCFSCEDRMTDPIISSIQQAVCCPSSTQHGAYCEECREYKKRIGASPPHNAEWVNGETCTAQCIQGFHYIEASGQCERPYIQKMFKFDECYEESTCKKCDSKSCYKDDCQPGNEQRLQAMVYLNDQCEQDHQFCGSSEKTIDLKDNPASILISPEGKEGLISKKGAFCEWKIKFINVPKGEIYEVKINQSIDICQIHPDGSIFLFEPNSEQIRIKEQDQEKSEFTFTIGALYYEDSQNEENRVYIIRKPKENPGSHLTIIIIVVVIVCLLIVGGVVVLLVVIKVRRLRRRKAQNASLSRANTYIEKKKMKKDEPYICPPSSRKLTGTPNKRVPAL